jgi:lipoprotein-anchoring transpeptidase ErfK/SrfK
VSRGLLAVFVALGLAAAGTFAAVSGATTSPPASGIAPGPPAITTEKATAARTEHAAAPAPETPQAPKIVTLPRNVRIAGVRVGTLQPPRAEKVVQKAFDRPLTVVVDRLRLKVVPSRLATAYVAGAVGRARSAKPGTGVPLVVAVKGAAVRTWAQTLAKRVNRDPAEVGVTLRDGRPYVAPNAFGKHLDQVALVQRVVHALVANTRRPVRVTTEKVQPRALAGGSPAVIVINRSENVLRLYKGTKPWRTFGVATGQAAYPTPRGRFSILVKWTNPWWYPPASPWAAGESPVPPGPSNPLGTRWMGISSPGVGIHGTPNPGSIGYSLSHGCIRMRIPEAEWLFDHVDVGTTVFIV